MSAKTIVVRPSLLIISLLLLLSAPAPAFAQDGDTIPKLENLSESQQQDLASLIELAENAEARKEDKKALQYFLDAYKLFPHPQLDMSLGKCYDRLGQTQKALFHLKRFVRLQPKAKETVQFKARIAELEKAAADAKAIQDAKDKAAQADALKKQTSLRIVTKPPGAVIYLNDTADGAIGTTPTIDLPVPPGSYTIIAKLDGFEPAEKKIELKSGERRTETIALVAKPKEIQDPGKGGIRKKDYTLPIVLGITGVVATASAVVFGSMHADYMLFKDDMFPDEEEDICAGGTCETLMYVSAGVAILSLSGALVLMLVDDTPTRKRGQLQRLHDPQKVGITNWSVWGDGKSTGFGVMGRF